MKSLLAAVGAGAIAVMMLAQPATAAPHCVWKGTYWRCWNGHSWYRDYHHKRAEIRHDRRRVQHLERKLHRDMYSGSSAAEVRRDMHRLNRAHRELQQDRRDLYYGR
jgi:hypothetical protein